MKCIEFDDLDIDLITHIDKSEGATIRELCSATSETYSKIWYRVHALARVGFLSLVRSRHRIYCFIANGEEE